MSSRWYHAAPAAIFTTLAALMLAAPADAKRPHEPVENPGSFQLAGYCDGFTVEVTYTDLNAYIIRETTVDGVTTQKITGYARVTVENLATGKSVSYNISGPGTVVIYPEGHESGLSFSIDSHGPNLLWTLPEFSFPGVPTISYTTGHVTVQVDASGETTSYNLNGRQTDVCAVLAS